MLVVVLVLVCSGVIYSSLSPLFDIVRAVINSITGSRVGFGTASMVGEACMLFVDVVSESELEEEFVTAEVEKIAMSLLDSSKISVSGAASG